MKPTMIKTSIREVKGSFGRYVAILAIVALGVGFFSGLKVSKTAMLTTGEEYLEAHAFHHFRAISTLGFTSEDVQILEEKEEIEIARGAYFADVIYQNQAGEEGVIKIHSITSNINELELISGRLPETQTECVVDANLLGVDVIGQTILLSENNKEETLDLFRQSEFVIVGICNSPNYISFERGTTSIGNGKINGFLYVDEKAFDSEYYMEIYLRTSIDAPIYTTEYDNQEEVQQELLETYIEERKNLRFEKIQSDAFDEIATEEEKLNLEEEDARVEFADALLEIQEAEQELVQSEKDLLIAQEDLKEQEESLLIQQDQLAQKRLEFEQNKVYLEQAGVDVSVMLQEIVVGEQTLESYMVAVKEGKKEIEEGFQKLETGKAELEEAKDTYQTEYEKFTVEIADAKEQIMEAKEEVETLDKGKIFVLGRNTNIGYAYFENDSGIVEGIANIFPIFFFLVAALVCITTMNRMVEEQRTQIGVMKALGYHPGSIMGKYMYYSGSAALIGSVIGYWFGTLVFPKTIWEAYKMMYQIGEIRYVFDWPLAIISGIVAALCSFGTTYLSCRHELKIEPAALIRPKAPKNGKRILLERIPFIWRRLKFLHKVSLRNVFRYKRKFFMMVLGIGGCTALLVTGFGIKDSIATVAETQFNEIQLYDISMVLSESPTDADREEIKNTAAKLLSSYDYFAEMSMDLVLKNKNIPLSLIIPESMDQLSNYLDLHTKKGEKLLAPEQGSIILNDKYARKYNLEVGDTIILQDEDRNQMELTIQGFNENFIFNYGYISKETYREAFGKEPAYKAIYGILQEDQDAYQAATTFMDLSEITSTAVNETIKDRFRDMMVSLDYIVLLVIFSAGGLAFIVLYNLTNINITERIREIATIKVLGFLPMETVSYVFRENLLLTIIGSLSGLVGGFFLHQYVMYNINVDAINFQVQILPASFLYSVLLTFLFALIVNIVMYFKLERIHMAESLKSNE